MGQSQFRFSEMVAILEKLVFFSILIRLLEKSVSVKLYSQTFHLENGFAHVWKCKHFTYFRENSFSKILFIYEYIFICRWREDDVKICKRAPFCEKVSLNATIVTSKIDFRVFIYEFFGPSLYLWVKWFKGVIRNGTLTFPFLGDWSRNIWKCWHWGGGGSGSGERGKLRLLKFYGK